MGSLCRSNNRWLHLAALVLLWIPAVWAQDADRGAKTEESAQPGDVNVRVSRVFTFVDKTGLGHQHAIEGNLAVGSTLKLGAESEAGKLVFDMRSFDADTSTARRYLGLSGVTDASTRSKVNANMKGRDVLNVQQYPLATFDVRSALATGKKSQRGLPTYELAGTFQLHGTSKPLRILAEVEQARGWLHVRGNFAISQTSYGITPFSKVFGAIGVTDSLRIHGDLWVAPSARISMSEIPERQ
jgi:polyisoprenoid-binding protein YceI